MLEINSRWSVTFSATPDSAKSKMDIFFQNYKQHLSKGVCLLLLLFFFNACFLYNFYNGCNF